MESKCIFLKYHQIYSEESWHMFLYQNIKVGTTFTVAAIAAERIGLDCICVTTTHVLQDILAVPMSKSVLDITLKFHEMIHIISTPIQLQTIDISSNIQTK